MQVIGDVHVCGALARVPQEAAARGVKEGGTRDILFRHLGFEHRDLQRAAEVPIRRARIFGIRHLHLLASCSTRRLLCLSWPSVITAGQSGARIPTTAHIRNAPQTTHGFRQPATMQVAPAASVMQFTCRCALRQARPAPLHNAGGLNRTLRVAHRQQQPQRIAARRQTVCSAQAAEVLPEITHSTPTRVLF